MADIENTGDPASDAITPEAADVAPEDTQPAEDVKSQTELDAPHLEKVDADDILGDDAHLPATVVTDGSASVPLVGPVTIGNPPDSNDSEIHVVAAQGAPVTAYSNYADGEQTGIDHPLDQPDNRMNVVPGFSMPPGASVGVPASLQERIDAVLEGDQAEIDADQAQLDADRAQLSDDETAGAAEIDAEQTQPVQGADVISPEPSTVPAEGEQASA